MSPSAGDGAPAAIAIKPSSFTPSSDPQAQPKRRWPRVVLALLLLLAMGVLLFLFTARSVTFAGADTAVRAQTSALLSLEVGQVHLLLPGDYEVTATATGYAPYRGIVTVSDTRNQAIALPLEPLPGRLQLSSDPSGATVVYQGSTVGETPVAALSLPAGPVELLINRERYQPARLALEIRG
ncbi:MAG: PEGA domain-containing protein, partial [Pseudomonadota bacterium]